MPAETIFTVGHSTHSIETFLELLRQREINCIVDVRSTPYSARVPHFNRAPLQAMLKQEGILYAHMPEEFGARKRDPELLDRDQKVDFDRVRRSTAFRRGIQRLRQGLGMGYRIALMCSEGDPFDCHRFSMISYQLVKEGIVVQHILRDGRVIDNSVLEERLLRQYGAHAAQPELFVLAPEVRSPVEEAYRLRGREVAFSATGAG